MSNLPRFLNVAFSLLDNARTSLLERVFNRVPDWIRYTPTTWLVWTSQRPDQWYRRVKPLLRPGEHVLVMEVDLTRRAGWMPTGVWDWIKGRLGQPVA